MKRAVRAAKTQLGLSNKALSDGAEIKDPTAMGEFLNGSRWFGDDRLGKLEKYFISKGVQGWQEGTIAALLHGTPLATAGDVDLERFLDEMSKVPPEAREALRALVRLLPPIE